MFKSRIFLIHCWGGSPAGDWLPWAEVELKKKGYEIITPNMPATDTPIIESWVSHLSHLVGELRSDDIFVGHSIGCQTILRYLEKADTAIDKVILVAPWFTLTNLGNEAAWKIADPWFKTPMDFKQIKTKAKKFITIFSDNDPWVPYVKNKQMFIEKLNPQIITLHNRGHITADEGSLELPELLPLLD
jgi:predicted alpha/beta hydrolase family esterase